MARPAVVLLTIALVLLATVGGARPVFAAGFNTPTPSNTPTAGPALICGTPSPIPSPLSLVSRACDGSPAGGSSQLSSISSDGRYVAYASSADNLVAGDSNGFGDIFVYDRLTGQTTRASVASNAAAGAPRILAAANVAGQPGHAALAEGAQANDASDAPSTSADGRYVAFESGASNLVAGDANAAYDVFVRDMTTGQTVRVSVSSLGAEANGGSYRPSISGDGRYIAFESSAANLVAGATDGSAQIFVHDQVTGKTTLVSTTSAGLPGRGGSSFDAAISADGKFVAFLSEATNLGSPAGTRGVYVHDMTTGQTALVSVTSDGTPGNSGPDTPPSISGDGRFVAFDSLATNLVAGDTNGVADIFVRDRQTGQTTRVSVATDGTQANYLSWNPSISADGNFVAFSSLATNLVPDDTNGYADIFVRNTTSGQTYRVSLGPISAQGNSDADLPSISGDGRFVSFRAADQSIIPGDANGVEDIFLYDRDSVPPPPTEGCFTLDVTSGEGGAANAIAQSQPNCESGHPAGSYVWLQAIPDRDHVFAGWSGDAVGAKQLLIVQMTGNKTVTANFLPKPIKPVVLLVHGWLGAQDDPPDHCQADPINYEPGSPSPIFDFGIIPSQLKTDGFDVFVAHLNSGPGAVSDVFQNAVCLRQQIASLRAKGVDKVVLLAHGAGGLVSRAYIENPVKGFYAGDVSKLITLGTPHTGTGYNSAPCLGDLSNAACLLTFYGSDLFNEIYPERAADVEYDFIGGKLDPLPGWPLLVTDGDNDGVVGVYSGMGQRLMVNENKVETIVTGDNVARYAIAAGHSNSNALLFPSYFNAASPTDTTITETYQCIRKILGVSGGTCPPEGQASGRGPITAISFSETSRNRIALASTSLAAEPVAASVRSFSGRLAADGVASHIVPVDSSGHAAFILTWSGGPLTFGLTDPEGKTIDPLYATQHPEEVTYKDNAADVSARHVAIYAFNAASPGLYILTITAGAVGPSGADYVAATLVESTRILKATTDYRLYAIGHTAKITAQLVNGDTALTGAQVQAEFYRPGVVDDAVTLADQGDGTYTGTFTIPDVPGYVGLRVTAQGSDGAVLYARQLDDMIAIAPLTAQLTGQYSVSLSDIDGKGKYDSLNIAVGLNMAQPGNYAVSADLVGANGEPVAHTSLVAALRPGAQYVTLPFDGDEIRRSGTNGPYTLTNFTIADEQAAGVPAIWRAANLMQTDGYQSADFAATCYTLDLSGVRGGTASADPAPNCYDGLQYVAGAEVTLTAHPDAGNFLTGWTSGVSGSAETVSVKMNQDIAVGARFSIAPPATATPAPGVVTQSIGSTGGSIICDQWILTVPAGVLADGSVLSCAEPVANIVPPAPPGFVSVGRVTEVKALDDTGGALTKFSQPLTICFSYSEADVKTAGGDPNNLVVEMAQAAGLWSQLATTVNAGSRQVCGTTDHFTLFGVFARSTGGATGPSAIAIVGLGIIGAGVLGLIALAVAAFVLLKPKETKPARHGRKKG